MSYRVTAITLEGLENVLKNELESLGDKDAQPVKRAVTFDLEDLETLAFLNLKSKLSLRFLLELAEGKASKGDEIYQIAKEVPWEEWFSNNNTFVIRSTMNSDFFKHSGYVGLKVKDAIADRFREKFGKRPNVDTENAEIHIYVNISKDNMRIGLDSSGFALSKRGYRMYPGKAPLSEVLGAGLVALSEWDFQTPLYAPFCGSGTIASEAVLIALGISTLNYKQLSMSNWKNAPGNFNLSSNSGVEKNLPEITASDISLQLLKGAEFNAERAGIKDYINFKKQDFFKTLPPENKGVAIMNPPYGEKLKLDEAELFYKQIGDKLKADYKGWTVWIFCSDNLAAKHIGLKPSKKIKLFNGALDCLFLKYEIFDGNYKTQKMSKEIES